MAIIRDNKTLNARQQAAQVRKWTGWTKEQYNKEYDKLRNRVRNYERANGLERGAINVSDLLAREARTQHYAPRYNETPQSTNLYNAIMATTSQSTGRELSDVGRTRSQAAAIAGIEQRYHGLLEKSFIVKEAVAELRLSNPNPSAAELEATILQAAREHNAYKAAQERYRQEQLKKGIIIQKLIDS